MGSLTPMHSRYPRRIAAIAAAASLATLTGCGEKDEPATTGPVVTASTSTSTTPGGKDGNKPAPQLVRESVEAFLTSSNAAAVCDRTITAKFLRKAYGDRKGCIAARKPATLADAAVIDVSTSGAARATAKAEAKGGIYAGQRLDVTLVLQGPTWRIDQVDSNVKVGP
jgi:hypothetical protein